MRTVASSRTSPRSRPAVRMARRMASADLVVQVGDLDQRLGAVDVDDLEPGDVTDPAGVAVGDQPQPLGPAGAEVLDGPLRDDPAARGVRRAGRTAARRGRAGGWRRGRGRRGRCPRAAGRPWSRPRRVEAGERFVEDERLRLVEQRGDDLDPLLVAEAELLDPVAGAVGEAEPLEARGADDAPARPSSPDELAEVDQLVEDLLLGVEAALLGHVAEAAPVGGGDRAPLPEHLTTGEPEQAHDHPHRRGLAGAVATDEAGEQPCRDVEETSSTTVPSPNRRVSPRVSIMASTLRTTVPS